MVRQLTLREVLEGAIQKEIMARFLYVSLRQRMRNQVDKDAFQCLAEQEEVHQRILEDYLHGKLKEGALNTGLVIDYKIAECLNQDEISPTMDIKEVFLLAEQKEDSAHDLYTGLSAIHPNGTVRHLLENLAKQELEHKNRLETIYTEVASPYANGG